MKNIQPGLDALRAVQKVFPGALLAGGYLRDAHLSRAPKDIDIFVAHSDTWVAGNLMMVSMTGAAEYMEQSEVGAIWNVEGFGLPVQVIMLRPGLSPQDRAEKHDFGVCQVWHDGDVMGFTSGFSEDAHERTFTLRHCEDQKEYDRSMRRWDRLKEKFPEFTLVVPEEFALYSLL